jgi:transcription-repair coupling factor (superfamily II helicase)
LTRLATRKPDEPALLVVTTASAVAQRAPPRARLAQAAFATKVGATVRPDEIELYAITNGYGRASTVRAPGDYALRGGVLDIFPPGAPEPLRFDFFGDQMDAIRAFDPETQRSTRQLREAKLTPVSEILLDADSVGQFRRVFAQSYGAVTDPVYDAVNARMRRQGIEQWLPFFYPTLETIFDYVGESALIGFEHLAEEARAERWAQAVEHYDSRAIAPTPRGGTPFRAPQPKTLYLDDVAFNEAMARRPVRVFTPFAAPEGQATISVGAREGRTFAAERATPDANVFDAARAHIETELKAKRRVVLAAWTEGSAERLGHVLADHGLAETAAAPSWPGALALPQSRPVIAVLPIERGFETDDTTVLSEQDVLGDRLARPRKRRKASSLIAEAAALSPGDLVVHTQHGIARYDGLKTLDVQDAPHDCLELVYSGGDKLYLPVENIELVTRYGSEDAGAQLDKLGGVAWQSRKARAQQRLRDMAEDLIRIAAARAARTADAIEPHAGAYDEFCARFPYDETDDQLAAIEDAMGDLASGRPMDRLICGDVGFGKTEVALRAAFLVAMSGRQVAVIAPTTLLCRQHYKTFTDRFRGLPIKVRQLSRLVTAKETTETKKELAAGEVDIIVGTHALLGKGVEFRDLGQIGRASCRERVYTSV